MTAVLAVGPLSFDVGARRLVRGGREVARLPAAQATLLRLLVGGETVAREGVSPAAGGRLWRYGRGMDQAASQLRATLERWSGGAVHILSERGVGYRLVVDADRAADRVDARLLAVDAIRGGGAAHDGGLGRSAGAGGGAPLPAFAGAERRAVICLVSPVWGGAAR